jgi:PEP-CTERM motif-containing protein
MAERDQCVIVMQAGPMENTMKNFLTFLAVLLGTSTANAGLIGDTVHVAHNWSTLGTEIYTPTDVLVADGVGDSVHVSPHYYVNIDDLSVFVGFSSVDTWSWGTFNGLVISDIDTALSDFDVTTNLRAWQDTRFTSSGDSLMFNWYGLPFDSDTFFQLTFTDAGSAQVPEPASLMLLGLGLVAVCFYRRPARCHIDSSRR